MNMNTQHAKLKFSKVLKGRENWRARANAYQSQKRKLQDRVRYLEKSIQGKDEQLQQAYVEIDTLKKNANASR